MEHSRRRIALIRVLTSRDPQVLESHGKILMALFPEWDVCSYCIPDQPEGIHDEETKKRALPKIERLAFSLLPENFDGIIVSCADDPAVESLRRQLSIPVIGAGRSTALLALGVGRRVGVIGITDETPAGMKDILKDFLIKEIRPKEVHSTLDLMTCEGRAAVLKEAMNLKKEGADVIALACTGMSTVSLASEIKKEVNIPVIDPVSAEGALMWATLGF
ncbi:MAG: aspartate/glutamate racemase family protein [Aminobacterium sp.]|jgi:Asp/Glu/hydantoin racemase|nr:aspartate/glutamate racemase family protein [Aminobacterium sp.]